MGANGPFTFATRIASGAPYAVTVKTNPAGFTCTVTNGSGTVSAAPVSNVTVTCTSAPAVCTNGTDPFTGKTWTVCAATPASAWVSQTSPGGGQYHADFICKSLGYRAYDVFGGNCGTICGYCQGSGLSCAAPGNQTFDGSGACGSDANGRILCYTVAWRCVP